MCHPDRWLLLCICLHRTNLRRFTLGQTAARLPTAAPAELDADVLIAAQAAEVDGTVVTTSPGHIGRWVSVHPWP
jgi:hypothetical protein